MEHDSAKKPLREAGSSTERVYAALTKQIAAELRAGDQIPTTRSLVSRFNVSPITVQRALARLAQEGLIATRPGHGAFVAERRERSAGADFGWQAVVLGSSTPALEEFHDVFTLPRPDLIPLGVGYLDTGAQPSAALASAVSRAARRPGAWDRVPAEGIDALRAWFARQVGDARVNDILIVPGGQSALSTIFRALATPGAPVLVESPAHLGTLAVLRAAGLRPIPVPCDMDGVRPDLLEAAFKTSGARVFACQPTYANPTGATLPNDRRRAVLEIARRVGAFIVEDDAARDLAIDGPPPPPLAADDDGHVVYVRSLTKAAAPGLRIAGVCARGPVGSRLRAVQVLTDPFVSGPMQEAALELVSSPAWARHLKVLRRALQRRRDAAVEAVKAHLPRARLEVVPKGGVVLWVELPEGVDDVTFARAAMDRGVHVNPGRAWFPAEPAGAFFRLSYAGAGATAIETGVTRLAGALDAALATRDPSRWSPGHHMRGARRRGDVE